MGLILSLLVFLAVWAIIFIVLQRFLPEIVSAIGLPDLVTKLILAIAGIFFIMGLLGFIPGYGGWSYYHYAAV